MPESILSDDINFIPFLLTLLFNGHAELVHLLMHLKQLIFACVINVQKEGICLRGISKELVAVIGLKGRVFEPFLNPLLIGPTLFVEINVIKLYLFRNGISYQTFTPIYSRV